MFDIIYRRWVFPRIDRKRGYDLLDRVRRFEEALAKPPADLSALQAERLRAIAVHAASTSPFWMRRFAEAGLDASRISRVEDLRALPILEKSEVRANREDMLSSAVLPEHRREATTGGSTASPLRFYRDPDCLADREASNWVFYRRIGRQPWDRWALVWGAMRDLGAVEGFRARLRAQLLERCIVLPGNRMDAASMDRFVARMRAFRPRFLHGYAQATYLLARHIEERRLKVPRLRGITVTAEPSTPAQRQTIASVFGAPVFNLYGTREFGVMAAECPTHAGMHINPLSTVVEFLAPDGSPAHPGEPGQVIVTDLLNRAMPLIRYRIGDIGVLSRAPCPCGSPMPLMEIASGRETDFILTPDGRCISGASITLVSHPGIAKLQYVQEEIDELVIRYVPTPSFTPDALPELESKLADVFGTSLRFRFQELEDIPLTAAGKFLYVVSHVARRRFSRGGAEPREAVPAAK